MGTFVTAYVVVLAAVVLYAARLGAEQRRMRRTLEALCAERQCEEGGQECLPSWSREQDLPRRSVEQ